MQTERFNGILKNKSDIEVKLYLIEREGYNLYYDEILKEWDCFGKHSGSLCKGENKIELIERAYKIITVE